MKIASTAVSEFINDLNLQSSEVGVCFEPLINFNLNSRYFNAESEVQIDRLLGSCVGNICLLNPVIAKYKLPTFFSEMIYQFTYQKYKGLIIKGHIPLFGPFIISVWPIRPTCAPNTFYELRAKMLN